MKKIGDITPTADEKGEFTDGDVSQYIPPTLLLAEWFNTVQRELCHVIGFDGTGTDDANDEQVSEAIQRMITQAINAIKLGNAAPLDIGTTAGTVAAGDDTRITGALQTKKFLQELKDAGQNAQRMSLANIGGFPSSGGTVGGDVNIQGALSVLTSIMLGGAKFFTNGDISGAAWGNGCLSDWINSQLNTRGTIDWIQQNFVQDVRLGSIGETNTINGGTADCPPGHVMVGAVMDVWGSRGSHLLRMRHSPLQKNINGTWYNVTRL
ncbi:hypothetical protein DO659_03385 [Salmonella enterica subsp. enterica serovar Minnesota]|nr:hypothetical protein [Salmonella enterica subsp. enterica serovar Minnesota]ECI4646692.1 hypothetical protein [Salmonella enterica subsp. salamae]